MAWWDNVGGGLSNMFLGGFGTGNINQYYSPQGDPYLLEAGRYNAAQTSGAIQRRLRQQAQYSTPELTGYANLAASIGAMGGEANQYNQLLNAEHQRQAENFSRLQQMRYQSYLQNQINAQEHERNKAGFWGSIAPILGTAAGAFLGGPGGAMLGSRLFGGGGGGGGGSSYGSGGDWMDTGGYQGYRDYQPGYGGNDWSSGGGYQGYANYRPGYTPPAPRGNPFGSYKY